jgi:hypothetical protein
LLSGSMRSVGLESDWGLLLRWMGAQATRPPGHRPNPELPDKGMKQPERPVPEGKDE